MNEESSPISQMRAVTISREYGSGGGEIATRLAQRLGWQLIDHEVVVQVAHELGVSEAEVEAHDERVESLLVNTGILTLEHVVRLICQALEYKANLLSTVTEELGPVRGRFFGACPSCP